VKGGHEGPLGGRRKRKGKNTFGFLLPRQIENVHRRQRRQKLCVCVCVRAHARRKDPFSSILY